MREDAKARHPARKQTRDSVRDNDVELRKPSLAESHEEDSRRGDDDGEDGSGAQSNSFLYAAHCCRTPAMTV